MARIPMLNTERNKDRKTWTTDLMRNTSDISTDATTANTFKWPDGTLSMRNDDKLCMVSNMDALHRFVLGYYTTIKINTWDSKKEAVTSRVTELTYNCLRSRRSVTAFVWRPCVWVSWRTQKMLSPSKTDLCRHLHRLKQWSRILMNIFFLILATVVVVIIVNIIDDSGDISSSWWNVTGVISYTASRKCRG